MPNDELKWGTVQEYLKSIGMISEIDTRRVQELYSHALVICPEKVKDIFIANYKDSDGKNQFKDLWLYSDNYVLEALNFRENEIPKIEMAIFNRNIQSITVETERFDIAKKANDASKFHLIYYTLTMFTCDQIAYGYNCDVLMSIYNKYIKPNLVRGQSVSSF